MLLLATLFILSAASAFGGVELIRRWALRRQLLDHPNERSSHTRPTPRGGGLAVVLVTMAASGLWLWFHRSGLPLPLWRYGLAGAGGALIAYVSWLDDSRGGVRSAVRYGVHAAGAALAMSAFGWWHDIYIPFIGDVHWGWFGLPVTFLWITGLVNAYNFMDGIDGIAGAQAVTACAAWLLLAGCAGTEMHATTVLGIVLAGSTLGFLALNWHPAKIFMGDVGSAFLGYGFAVFPLLASADAGAAGGRLPVFALLAVAPFVLDASFTFFRRLHRRENVFAAHRSHLYQRLVISGLSHQTVTLLYLFLGMISSAAALLIAAAGNQRLAGAMAVIAVGLVLGIPLLWTSVRERKPPHTTPRAPTP
jgi:UDP-N-acetylmuramyl pentapeptide phosphotransferase/UDP-N-acetylglucosamine-1-phosphate transferase